LFASGPAGFSGYGNGFHADVVGKLCSSCPLRELCTKAAAGREVTVHPREATLKEHRTRQKDPAWKQRYRATRPKVERKIGHFVRRSWGGRKARTRGKARVLTDVLTRAAVLNLARLGVLGLRHDGGMGPQPSIRKPGAPSTLPGTPHSPAPKHVQRPGPSAGPAPGSDQPPGQRALEQRPPRRRR
jgi:Transposase DDE domain